MVEKKKVVIAEDQALVRAGLKSLLNDGEDIIVIGEAEDGLQAIKCIEAYKPDLLVLDLAMPKMDGISAIREIKSRFSGTKILALTFHTSDEYILTAFKAGADGYSLKSDSYSELLIAIKSVFEGKRYISPTISGRVLEGYLESKQTLKTNTEWESLTPREREVLKMVGEGYKSTEIADYLCISPKTVDKHRSNIMKKLDLHSASALTAYAIEKGLVVK